MKIRPVTAILVSVIITIAGIVATSALGLWSTTSEKVPVKYEEAAYKGEYNPADIRGSYTFTEVGNLFQIPMEDLAEAFLLTEKEAKELKCKDLETIFADAPNEIGTASVRMFTAFYKGLPFDLGEDTYLTENGAAVLVDKGNMTDDQSKYLEMHTVHATR
jgi:hypothetical protein